jgi:hypothetical protein
VDLIVCWFIDVRFIMHLRRWFSTLLVSIRQMTHHDTPQNRRDPTGHSDPVLAHLL